MLVVKPHEVKDRMPNYMQDQDRIFFGVTTKSLSLLEYSEQRELVKKCKDPISLQLARTTCPRQLR